jgi:hypothetical protein
MKPLVLATLLGLTGCIVDTALKAVDSVPRAVGEASRKRAVSPWAGRYLFSECSLASPGVCWTYDVLLDSSGTATVRADGAGLSVHVTSKPEAEGASLRLPFAYYNDGNPDDGFIHSPFERRKGFSAGELLATIGRDPTGRACLAFGALRSPLGSRVVCAP